MRLTGRVSLVTGGSRGIGEAIAIALAAEGSAVAVNYREDHEGALATVRQIEGMGGRAMLAQADVSVDRVVRAMVDQIYQRLGRLDVVINNAAWTKRVPLADLEAVSDADWERILSVDLLGAFYCTRAAAPLLRASGRGCVVNIASTAALTGDGSSIPYVAAKAGLLGLTKSLALALAPEVRVNAVAPGFVPTGVNAGHAAWHQALIEGTPLRRIASPADIASATVALVAEATFITGTTLVVDGGRALGAG